MSSCRLFSMEFAVLELGLKNKQIFNVTSFLRIQVEAFRVNWEKLCTNVDGTGDDDCLPLFDDWEKVFSKILIILKATLHIGQSREENEFGRRLVRISLQTSNSLLEILSREDSNYCISPSLDREKIHFIASLTNQVNLIRTTIGAVIAESNIVVAVEKTPNDVGTEIFRGWIGTSKQHILINCIKDQCLPLGQYYIVCKRKEPLPWSSINETTYRSILNHLKAGEIKQVENILIGLGFDCKFLLKYILEHSFTDKLQTLLVDRLDQEDRPIYERLCLIERVNEPFHLKLSLSCVRSVKPSYHGDLLTFGIFQENLNNRTSCLKVVEPHQIWSYLVKTNRTNLIKMWITRYFDNAKTGETQEGGTIFSAKITQKMIDQLIEDGQDYLRESTLSTLGNFGIFSSSELNNMPLLIRRLFRSCSTEKTGILTGFKDHPLFNKTSLISYEQFHKKFIEYCADNSLYQTLYWSYVQNEFQVNLEKCPSIDTKLVTLLLRFKTWNEDPLKDYYTLNSILEVARYLHYLSPPVNLQSLLDAGLGKLAILASQFAPKGTLSFLTASPDELWFAEKDSLLSAMEKYYPLLYLAMVSMKELNLPSLPSQGSEFPSIYTLLKETIDLDVSRLFTWQTTNTFRTLNDSTILGELPHFSHPKLVGLGLKANLTFIYHLKRGRPFEAFTRWMSTKSTPPSPKKINIVCKRAVLLAFYNCTSLEITSACVTFLELFKINSTNLRLHLAIGNLIMTHAGKYLGLETKAQSIELGNVLRKAFYHSEKGAITHLMELLLTSFGKKYGENECTMDECVEYQLAISFSNHHKLDLPLTFLNKCIDCNDWLMFTVYSQFYEYPKEIVCKLLTTFSGCITEHLEKAFSSSMVTSERKSPQSIVRRRVTESRDTLYSRLGLLKTPTSSRPIPALSASQQLALTPEDDRASVISETDLSNLETASVASSSMIGDLQENQDFDPESPPKDLFNLVLTCQRYHPTEPGKSLLNASLVLGNPIPALIAASLYSNSENESVYSTFDCFCCWLHSSFQTAEDKTTSRTTPSIIWNQSDFNTMIQSALQVPNNFIVFRNAFRIFALPNMPIIDLVQFFIEFLVEKDYYDSVKKLKTFQECLWNYKKPVDSRGLLSSKAWMEETSVIILSSGLKAADSEYELHILLRHLDFARLQSSFDEETAVPDFRKIYRLSQSVQETDLSLNICDFLDLQPGTHQYTERVLSLVYELQDRGYYSEAQQFAAINEIIEETVHINEWRQKIQLDKNNFLLWKSCFIDLEDRKIDWSTIRKFIAEFRSNFDSELILAFILAKDFYYATRSLAEHNELTSCEINLWNTIISIELNSFNPDELIEWTNIWENILRITKDIIPPGMGAKGMAHPVQPLTNEQVKVLRVIVGKILNVGKIELAYRLSYIFKIRSQDLLFINFSNLLADDFFSAQTFSAKTYFTVTAQEYGFRDITPISSMLEILPLEPSRVVKILEKCLSYVEYAVNACQRIILYYKIGFVIGKRYSELAEARDELIILSALIKRSTSNSEALAYAKELIVFAKIVDDQVSNLLLKEILPLIERDISETATDGGILPVSNESATATTNFLALIRLINDPAILGRQLLGILKTDVSPLMAVELCIKAHECFTLCCDIEGISLVLRNARILVIQNLSLNKNHQSMIRLLTGIGRYSEMSYIFDILREDHQFELLLRRGNQKCAKLRVALLDYLKGDREMYPLIALNFSMHREIAEMLESGAIKSLNSINLRRQQNFMSFKEELEKILQEIMDAAESYKKAGVNARSEFCDKMAQLVALQIHYLPSGVILINLSDTLVTDFITRHSKFMESLIVADAYQNHRQWAIAIFNNVVNRGDWTYLRDYNNIFPLNPNNLEEIYGLYIKFRTNNRTLPSDKLSTIKSNLHKLVKQSNDLVQIYKYSQELGFVEASNNLLKDINGAYLSDLRRQGNL